MNNPRFGDQQNNSSNINSKYYLSKPASTGTNKNDRFREVAGFVRLPLQRNVRQDFTIIGRYSGRADFLRGCFREVSLYIPLLDGTRTEYQISTATRLHLIQKSSQKDIYATSGEHQNILKYDFSTLCTTILQDEIYLFIIYFQFHPLFFL
jgi:hypothetical protein